MLVQKLLQVLIMVKASSLLLYVLTEFYFLFYLRREAQLHASLICNLFPPQALSSYNDLVLIEAAFMCLSRLQVILCKVSSVIYNKSFKDAGRNPTAPNSGTYLKPSIRNFWLSVS